VNCCLWLRSLRSWCASSGKSNANDHDHLRHPGYVKTLREAGVDEKQAEAQAVALASVLKSGVTDLATKQDMELLRAELKKDLA
jgi:hypothetical protein